jgi:integrase
MATNTLTDSKCKAAKPKDKPQKISDGGGLYLHVMPTGSKLWRLAYRVDGKQQTASFGPYPEVSLAAARQMRDDAKSKLRSGAPVKEKPQRVGLTLTKAHDVYWSGRKHLSEGYLDNERRAFEMHVEPHIGTRPIASITRADLLAVLNILDEAWKHNYVRKIRMWLAQVWDWAIEQGEATENPARTIKPERAFGKKAVKHFAALTLPEVPDLIERLSYEDELQSVLGCKMLALTWVRTKELRMMEWSEIDGDLWRIPEGKMKRKRDHLIPLSTQALGILDKLRKRSRGSVYVFPNDRRLDRPMSENSILYMLGRIGYKGRTTGHGFRTIGSTWANENGYSKDAIERQLAHAPDDKVRAIYNRAEFMPERRNMLQDFADWLIPQSDVSGSDQDRAD